MPSACVFLGALVRGISTSIGWGVNTVSQLNLQLVDDPANGYNFTPVGVGTPVYFQYGNFTFSGLLQKYEKKRGTDGNPVYEVIVVDPREILDGAQLILDGYNGSVGGVRNLYNVYGYWENQAFGGSLANESGMPWYKISAALNVICNTPNYSTYGGPLTFRNNTYSLDLSQLPSIPNYYRLGGSLSISILEAISQICEDFGYDFYIELVGTSIKVRTVSRINQLPLGTIDYLAGINYSTSLVRSYSGLETRNEQTSSFLVGGPVTSVWMNDDIVQFWGYDINGNPITSTNVTINFFNSPINPLAPPTLLLEHQTEGMNLNASCISDIIGDVVYPCTTLEMRLAQTNYESWAFWMTKQRPILADIIGLSSPFKDNFLFGAAAIRAEFVNDNPENAFFVTQNAVANDEHARSMRVYEFVRGIADEYMGKKYLVSLPFIFTKTDVDTGQITTSYEITDSAYLKEDASALGLSTLNEDIFKTPENKFIPFCIFENVTGLDMSKITPNGTAIEGNSLYMSVQIDPRIILTPTPAVVVTINGPLTEQATDNVGDLSIISAILQQTPAVAQVNLQQAPIPLKCSPANRSPAIIAIPLKSNVLTYGPWYASGAAGKVRIEQDPSLVPWNYGGYEPLNLNANARVLSSITNSEIVETGALELEGVPGYNLGDVLHQSGPNITNIDVQFGTNGVTTSYRFQTFSNRFGVLNKSLNQRLTKIALANVNLKRALRASLNERVMNAEAVGNAARTAKSWMEYQAKAHKRETPVDCIVSSSFWDFNDNSVRQNVGCTTMEEAITLSNANDPSGTYRNTAIMSMNGLFRPFRTSSSYSGILPNMASGVLYDSTTPNKNSLSPWKQFNDIECYSWGNQYEGLHAYRRVGDYSNARAIGLRAPLMLVGWGFNTDCNVVPGTGLVFDFDHNYRQDKWKAGPLDPLWDERRGVWTVHSNLVGRTTSNIPANSLTNSLSTASSGSVQICKGNVGDAAFGHYDLNVYNWFSTQVQSGVKVIINYVPTHNKWFVVAADCT